MWEKQGYPPTEAKMETGGIKTPFRANFFFTTACVFCTENFIRGGRCPKGVST